MYTVMDLFCGTGGFSKGFENAGEFRVVYGIDILPIAIKTFRANHPTAYSICGDIREIRRSQIAEATGLKSGDVDVIIGGPHVRDSPQSAPLGPPQRMTQEILCLKNSLRM